MEENVALDSSKQKKFVKSMKGIKKLLKLQDPETKASAEKTKDGKITKRKRPERGLVYLSHIPHGFYENEMTQYFKQFGMVTNARVIRSKKTGNSKGYAFVEFREPSVAEIVADTMNNYLMGKRLLKAAIIPPEKQRFARRKHWSIKHNPANDHRIKMKKAHNAVRDDAQELKRARKILATLNKTQKKLQELGINYDFFAPVDMPEGLMPGRHAPVDMPEALITADVVTSVNKKDKKSTNTALEQTQTKKSNEKARDVPKKQALENVKGKSRKCAAQPAPEAPAKQTKVKTAGQPATAKQMKEQKKKMLSKGVTPLEEFIEIHQDDEDSDESGSEAFDSDEFDKVMESDEEFDSNDENDASNDESDDDTNDEPTDGDSDEEDVPAPKKSKGSAPTPRVPPQKKKHIKTAPQKPVVAQNKPKFEKQNKQKPRNKQFKKK